jgi:hypothetical protein
MIVGCKARICSGEIAKFLMQATSVALNLQVFLFNVANAPAGIILN